MQRIGLVMKRAEQQALDLGATIYKFLQDNGKEVILEKTQRETAKRWSAQISEHITDDSDLLVVLGGDGTILRAASLLNDKPLPMLGVNLGRVGFMAEVSPEDAVGALQTVLDGTAEFTERMLIEVTLPNGKNLRVLNEAVIHWGGIARLIDLGMRMGDSREIEVRADGLIVSTPVGSSAYSYAAHGPLVHPDVHGILLTPICPYAGLKRPLLIPPDLETELVMKRGEGLTLTADGHTTVPLKLGQIVKIKKAAIPFIMVKSQKRDYFDVLKEKLHLI